jgi:hypothetical protein
LGFRRFEKETEQLQREERNEYAFAHVFLHTGGADKARGQKDVMEWRSFASGFDKEERFTILYMYDYVFEFSVQGLPGDVR